MDVDPLCFGVVWQLGAQKYESDEMWEWKEEWIPPNPKYQEILEANVQRSVWTWKLKRGWVFQQDNDPKYTSKSNMKYLQESRMKVLEWPQSPDLNIIENLWRDLKHTVHARKNGEKFQKRELKDLAAYRKRLQAVIVTRGGVTKY